MERGAGGKLEPFLICPGCHESKPIDQWVLITSDFDPQSPEVVCDSCRTNGIPRIPKFTIALHHRKLIDAYFGEDDPRNALAAASRASGLTQRTIKDILAGRRAPEVRRVFQLKLEAMGLGPEGVATILGDCAKATEQKWNPKEEEFNEFPDYRTRLNTIKYAGKLQELEPPKVAGPAQVNNIVIKTNLGISGDPVEVDSPSRLRVRKPEEVVDIDVS